MQRDHFISQTAQTCHERTDVLQMNDDYKLRKVFFCFFFKLPTPNCVAYKTLIATGHLPNPPLHVFQQTLGGTADCISNLLSFKHMLSRRRDVIHLITLLIKIQDAAFYLHRFPTEQV